MDGMNELMTCCFSDETVEYRMPNQPSTGERVTCTVRTPKGGVTAWLCTDGQEARTMMELTGSDRRFDYYSTAFECGSEAVRYHYIVEKDGAAVKVCRTGTHAVRAEETPDHTYDFSFTPGFRAPRWAEGAIFYQIFVDRFCNGDPANDPVNGEYRYLNGRVKKIRDWTAYPKLDDPRCFYGGDLAGVISKLDHLAGLGVEAIYFNPLFVSPSNHKYDTQDYGHIDPHYGKIVKDGGAVLKNARCGNDQAERYKTRVTESANLEASDALFAQLCREAHARGIRIVLDGVFNHCGSMNRWLDREGIYRHQGAWGDPDSAYRKYFRFSEGRGGQEAYEGWWGYDTLPKLNYDECPELCEEIFQIAEKWAKPPYSIDGWRLDVAADLGHSSEFNHRFWKEFRRRLKAISPDILIIAEHYGDPGEWLKGDEWDTVMNYDGFMDPVGYFLTGMEKHSDSYNDALYRDGRAFFANIMRCRAAMQQPSALCAMNELSNHDHARFLTRTNRTVGRTQTKGPEAASEGISKGLYRCAAVMQYTWPGAPTIYYGDEAGVTGWTDPDNRRTYPWGSEDRYLLTFHRRLAALRRHNPVLRRGSLIELYAEYGVIAYARFDRSDIVITAVNVSDEEKRIRLNAGRAGAEDGTRFTYAMTTDEQDFDEPRTLSEPVRDGMIDVVLKACTSAVLTYSQETGDRR